MTMHISPEEESPPEVSQIFNIPLRVLEGTARVISGDFDIILKESTQGRWYYRFDTHEIGYLSDDLIHPDEDIPLAFLMHEVSHALNSDLSVVDEELRQNTAFHTLLNAIEDVRVNELVMKSHPGSAPQLRKLYTSKFVVSADRFEEASLRMQAYPLHLQFDFGLLYEWFMMETDPRISDLRVLALLEECRPAIKAAYSAPTPGESYRKIKDCIWPRYQELIEEARNDAVEQELATSTGNPQEPSGSGSHKSVTQEPADLNRTRKNADEHSGDDEAQSRPLSEELRREAQKRIEEAFRTVEQEFNEAMRGKMLPDPSSVSEDEDQYAVQFYKSREERALENKQDRQREEESRDLESTSSRVRNILRDERLKKEGITLAEEEFYHSYLAGVRLYVSGLVRQLRTVFKDVVHQRMVTNLASGELSQSNLAIIPTGTDRIFERELAPGKFEYNVSILVDESDSMMDDDKYKKASEGVVLLQEALSQISGVSFEIAGFNANPHIPHKSFDDPLSRKKAIEILQSIEKNIGGSTADTKALAQACERIQRRHGKNMVIILTDGNPNRPSDRTDLEAVINKAKKVRVFALGIGGSTLVEKVYPTGLSVGGLSEVTSKLTTILRRELRK